MKCACKQYDCNKELGVDSEGGTIIFYGSSPGNGGLLYLSPEGAKELIQQLQNYLAEQEKKEVATHE